MTFPNSQTPPCRGCGKVDSVACYPDDHAQTVCVECCATAEHADGEIGHQFEYYPGEGWSCRYCGVDRSATDFDPRD